LQNDNGFRWRDADAYLFDIDGTLLLSPDRTHRYALHRALLEVYGLETTIDGIAYHGKTDPGIVRAAAERAGITTDVIDQSMAAALEVVRRDAAEKAERFRPNVLPGIREVLDLLRGAGKLLGVSSGNLESIAWIKLKAAGLAEYFEFGCFADECELRVDVFSKAILEVRRRLVPTRRSASSEIPRTTSAPPRTWAAGSSPWAQAFSKQMTLQPTAQMQP
jgi:hypothetical protein